VKVKKIMPLVTSAAIALGIVAAMPAAGSSVQAQQNLAGLKDAYANYFRVGTCYQWRGGGLSNTTMRDIILSEFNSVTHEDDLKPYNTMVRAGSTDNDIKVTLNSGARQVMQFCVDNNIALRGHAFVWHQQTSNWFFFADMQNGSPQNLASPAVMNRRMESYIKNLLELIKSDYPALNLYAYDVVNEIFLDNGTPRSPGGVGDAGGNNGTDQSPWVQIYGDNSFADSAFVYARKHGAATFPGMKLFYNDFNEYHPDGKRDAIVAMANRLGHGGMGVMDGIGMQSHLSTNWPPIATYKTALTASCGDRPRNSRNGA
jgi:GH35 family endo-1,4-beta-xylanase